MNALANGCREIILVEFVERALSLHTALFDTGLMLYGERDGMKINGFDLENSPLEYTRDNVRDTSLIFAGTNGSVALVKLQKCKTVYICGFQNMETVVESVAGSSEFGTLDIICSGHKNQFALEDIVCAGKLIERIHA